MRFRKRSTSQLDILVDEFLHREFVVEDFTDVNCRSGEKEFYEGEVFALANYIRDEVSELFDVEDTKTAVLVTKTVVLTKRFVERFQALVASLVDRSPQPGPVINTLKENEAEDFMFVANELSNALLTLTDDNE